jgi:CRISPR/Cas system-associated exonuclease Cas4 (RecB family)
MSTDVLMPLPLKPVLRISPSRYSALRACSLREIWASNHQPPLLPISPSARVGMIAHRLLQFAFAGELRNEHDMQTCWEKEVWNQEQEMQANPLEKHLVPLANSVRNFQVKQIMVYNIVRPVLSDNTAKKMKVRKSETEVWVQTEDGKIGGRIDLVRHSDGKVFIVDYKTGTITDSEQPSNHIKDEYQNQLKMYAALYYLTHKRWPNRLILMGLNQYEYDVIVNEEECTDLIRTAVEFLDELNKNIEAGLDTDIFATPCPETCKYCTYRPSCKKYWASRNGDDKWPADFVGAVIEQKVLGNGLYKVELENEGIRVTVRGLSPKRHYFLNERCEKIMICNLGKDTVQRCFREIPLTTGYRVS